MAKDTLIMQILSIKNPRYNSQGSIDLTINTAEFGEITFSASSSDSDSLGSSLYHRAINKEFGNITPYTPDLTLLAIEKVNKIKEERDKALSSGIIVDGIKFDTDEKAILAYMRFIIATILNPSITIPDWKASDNTWVTMDAYLISKILTKWLQVEPAAFSWQKNKLAEVQSAYQSSDVTALSNVSTIYGV